MAIDPQLWALIQRFAKRYRYDPRAAAAVAMVEGGGRFGAVGDSGSSYGPWQLHVGGALPAGRGAGWANSPAGIRYALRHIGLASRGLRGRAAVAAIVNQFERPAAPGAEIQRALGYYGQALPHGGALGAAAATPRGSSSAAALAALGLLGRGSRLMPQAPLPSAQSAISNLLPLPALAAPAALAPLPAPDYSGTLDAIHKRLLAAS